MTEEEFHEEVGRKARRKIDARKNEDRSMWFGLGMMGMVGWAVAIPTLLGIGAGLWLDSRTGGRISWTLTGLGLGIILGCLNAWYWVRRESRDL